MDDQRKVMAGGSACTYLGKQVPCFFGTSPKASITSVLLADMLQFIDKLGVYDRSIADPFLLLDGHHSRMMLPFLKYINDPSHKWHCCFGVPYAREKQGIILLCVTLLVNSIGTSQHRVSKDSVKLPYFLWNS